jgi:predicted ATP-dependent serine protease
MRDVVYATHAGELRSVRALDKRVAAAINLGFERVVAPAGAKQAASVALRGQVVECSSVHALIQYLRQVRWTQQQESQQSDLSEVFVA